MDFYRFRASAFSGGLLVGCARHPHRFPVDRRFFWLRCCDSVTAPRAARCGIVTVVIAVLFLSCHHALRNCGAVAFSAVCLSTLQTLFLIAVFMAAKRILVCCRFALRAYDYAFVFAIFCCVRLRHHLLFGAQHRVIRDNGACHRCYARTRSTFAVPLQYLGRCHNDFVPVPAAPGMGISLRRSYY